MAIGVLDADEPVVILARAYAKEETYEEVLTMARYYAIETRKESGVLYYNFYQDVDDKLTMYFHGVYGNMSVLQRHRLSWHHRLWGELEESGALTDVSTVFLRQACPELCLQTQTS